MISDRVKTNLRETFSNSFLPKLGLVLLVVIILLGTFAPLLATHDPTRTGYYSEEGAEYPPLFTQTSTPITEDGEFTRATVEPTSEHILGTNNVGQDVFSRFLYGARVSVLVAVFATFLALLIGVPIGLVAGYYGGKVDDTLMRLADIMLAFPALVLALALIGVFGSAPIHIPDPFVELGVVSGMPESIPIPGSVTLVAALVIWVWFARVARGEAISLRNAEYVKASKSYGMSDAKILATHILPNSLTPIIVLATIQVAAVILLEASLAYLGFSGTTLSWGYDIERGQDLLQSSWWISVVPGIGIMLAIIGVNLLGDWLRDALDPNIEGGERGV
ncbi:ABC-type dipeptide/oligopeptide/nickel transport system, permease component [Halovivax ruber XH-70]|uniref:ABC-type dipeptide/oligopeptide/nickel transport system, permease component n=1 Tax=Halovivax ruber (strain DSM 18193 / JCM 13892 / XH-70) TaxID=797302 RepID=L0IEG1_HALRX|nr:ABC transporter permease [Halovivax ruber]AGB16616.1 ABC-type dipeptide/oligopeptide/nickel transport system, permease component [Halovivax ruber XH-70]